MSRFRSPYFSRRLIPQLTEKGGKFSERGRPGIYYQSASVAAARFSHGGERRKEEGEEDPFSPFPVPSPPQAGRLGRIPPMGTIL